MRICMLAALLWAALMGAAQAQERVALVVGNSAYRSVPRLPNPARDAPGVARALRGLGFAVVELQNQTYAGLRQGLLAFAAKAQGAELAVVYYAGHGIEVDGVNYLIPIDAGLATDRTLEFEAIPLGLATQAASPARRLGLVIVDACRENPFANRMRSVGATRNIGRGLGRVGALSGNVLVAYAAAEGELAADGSSGGHSPYAAALIAALEGPRRPLERLFGAVRDDVLAATNYRQRPFLYGSLGAEAVYLHPAGATPPPRDPCAGVVRPGYRCEAEGGVAVLVPLAQESRPDGAQGDFALGGTPFVDSPPQVGVALGGSPLSGVEAQSSVSGTQRRAREVFKDCAACPEMVVIPSGSFVMGSPEDEVGRNDDEGPQTPITLGSFALGRYEVTFAEWDACAAAGACRGIKRGGNYLDGDQGWGRGSRPVITVNVPDAEAYIGWLNSQVEGSPYRLPSEAEWEYAARVGSRTAYPWGSEWSASRANGGGTGKTVEVGQYVANGFGLHDMIGNVWEWTADCWNASYRGRPRDGGAWLSGECSRNVLRGGSWFNSPRALRAANRYWFGREGRSVYFGFRVARTLR